jgi:hypothetical protein
MNHFKQRGPNFIDSGGINPVEFDFSTVEELEQHSNIQRWLNKSSSYLCKSEEVLMVVEDDGFTAWGIGWIKNPDELDLPIYEKKTILQYPNGKIEISTQNSENPVVSWCGGEATLKDGTTCKYLRYEEWKKLEETK